jgi:hypothetical protein
MCILIQDGSHKRIAYTGGDMKEAVGEKAPKKKKATVTVRPSLANQAFLKDTRRVRESEIKTHPGPAKKEPGVRMHSMSKEEWDWLTAHDPFDHMVGGMEPIHMTRDQEAARCRRKDKKKVAHGTKTIAIIPGEKIYRHHKFLRAAKSAAKRHIA